MATLLQLSLCVVTAIQLTSSQSTYDIIQHDSDVIYCGRSEQMLSQLVTAVSQTQMTVSQSEVALTQLQSFYQENVTSQMQALTQLQKDVAQLKSFNQGNATSQMAVSQIQVALTQL